MAISYSNIAITGSKSHGCGAVVCTLPDGSVTVDVIDHYEMVNTWKFSSQLGDKGINALDKVYITLNRLASIDPERAEQYRLEASTFFDNEKTIFKPYKILGRIEDHGYIEMARNCELEQAVIKMDEPELPGDKMYTINQDLWDLMDNDNRAMLILHEIIYSETISLGHQTSRKARYYNAHISSNRLEEMTSQEYGDLERLVFSVVPTPP